MIFRFSEYESDLLQRKKFDETWSQTDVDHYMIKYLQIRKEILYYMKTGKEKPEIHFHNKEIDIFIEFRLTWHNRSDELCKVKKFKLNNIKINNKYYIEIIKEINTYSRWSDSLKDLDFSIMYINSNNNKINIIIYIRHKQRFKYLSYIKQNIKTLFPHKDSHFVYPSYKKLKNNSLKKYKQIFCIIE
jgi:hypothetical protein